MHQGTFGSESPGKWRGQSMGPGWGRRTGRCDTDVCTFHRLELMAAKPPCRFSVCLTEEHTPQSLLLPASLQLLSATKRKGSEIDRGAQLLETCRCFSFAIRARISKDYKIGVDNARR